MSSLIKSNFGRRVENFFAPREQLVPPTGQLDFDLEPDEVFGLSHDNIVVPADIVREHFKLDGPVIASVRLGDANFYHVISVTQEDKNGDPKKSLVVAQETFQGRHVRFTAVPSRYIESFSETDSSPRAFDIAHIGDYLAVRAYDGPTVHMYMGGPEEKSNDLFTAGTHLDNRTVTLQRRLGLSGLSANELSDTEAPYGRYHGYPLLGRDSPKVAGGVYMGASEREAILVDAENLESYYQMFKRYMIHEQVSNDELAQIVTDYVMKLLRGNINKAIELSSQYSEDQVVPLSEYVKLGAGYCRHRAPLATHFLQRLTEDGVLVDGRAHLERKTIIRSTGAYTHAWAAIHPTSGEKLVADPTLGASGTPEKAAALSGWDYRLSTD